MAVHHTPAPASQPQEHQLMLPNASLAQGTSLKDAKFSGMSLKSAELDHSWCSSQAVLWMEEHPSANHSHPCLAAGEARGMVKHGFSASI